MSDRRQGLNCTLSYTKSGRRQAYRVRANMLTHGMKVIYDESQARIRKAFYPHRLSSAQFLVGIDLVGEQEYTSFVRWLTAYADHVLDPDLGFGEFPSMVVSLPSRNFLRKGVPLTGFEWSDQVGKMVWTIPLLFETAGEPGEVAPSLSTVKGYALYAKDSRYFYPTGTQLSGDQIPPDGTYAVPVALEDVLPPTTNTGRSLLGGTTRD